MKADSDKSHLLLSSKSDVDVTAQVNRDIVSNSKSEKLYGVTIDYKLTFDERVSQIFDKASQKISALSRISSFMKPVRKGKIMKAFISSQFGYCLLVCFFSSQTLK